MRSYLSAAATALLALALTACATRTPQSAEPVPVLLISIDGFRNDYFERGITPNLERIAHDGVRAAWMNPSYPSLTFPNHYSIVTGLRPDHHGIVHNSMWEDGLGDFRVADRKAVGDTRWWGGEPIWVGAEKAGLRSATLFWPGSEAPVQGVRPTRWQPFDEKISADARVDEVLGWLGESAATRPRVITLYFDALDKAGHEYGPDSAQAREATRTIDAALGRLLDGLAARDQLERVNLIVVSDHGMATVAPGHAIAVEDMVSVKEATVVSIGQSIGIAPKPGFEAAVAAKLIGRHEHYECWRKGELPARWHYGSHPRVPAIVCQMHEGWDAIERSALAKRPNADRGSHGYDPALASMRAIFLARGPAFRRGATLPAFDNVDVYPLLARLVGIAPARNDGDIAPLLPALRDDAKTP